jgi:hypothetical protein
VYVTSATQVTYLLLDGVPLKVVYERLGPAKTSITLDTYAHALRRLQHLPINREVTVMPKVECSHGTAEGC